MCVYAIQDVTATRTSTSVRRRSRRAAMEEVVGTSTAHTSVSVLVATPAPTAKTTRTTARQVEERMPLCLCRGGYGTSQMGGNGGRSISSLPCLW